MARTRDPLDHLPPSERPGADDAPQPGTHPNVPGSGEFLVELPDGTVCRIGDVPEEYRDRHKPGPNEVVIRNDEDLQKILDK